MKLYLINKMNNAVKAVHTVKKNINMFHEHHIVTINGLILWVQSKQISHCQSTMKINIKGSECISFRNAIKPAQSRMYMNLNCFSIGHIPSLIFLCYMTSILFTSSLNTVYSKNWNYAFYSVTTLTQSLH